MRSIGGVVAHIRSGRPVPVNAIGTNYGAFMLKAENK